MGRHEGGGSERLYLLLPLTSEEAAAVAGNWVGVFTAPVGAQAPGLLLRHTDVPAAQHQVWAMDSSFLASGHHLLPSESLVANSLC